MAPTSILDLCKHWWKSSGVNRFFMKRRGWRRTRMNKTCTKTELFAERPIIEMRWKALVWNTSEMRNQTWTFGGCGANFASIVRICNPKQETKKRAWQDWKRIVLRSCLPLLWTWFADSWQLPCFSYLSHRCVDLTEFFHVREIKIHNAHL